MMRMVRWSYVAPRLGLLLAFVCCVELTAGWVVKQMLRTSGEAAIGARVDIAKSQATVLGARVSLRGLQVANPNKPMTNLVEADSVELDLDSSALLHKRVVVTRGTVRGLQVGSSRAASGALSSTVEAVPAGGSPWVATGGEQAKDWLESVGRRFAGDFQDSLASPRVARELRDKWPARYNELAASVATVKADAEKLKADILAAKENPLRHAAFLQEAPGRVTQLRETLTDLTAELQSLPTQVEADKQSVAAAKRQDEQLIRESLAVPPIDGPSLSTYLLGEEIAGPMNEVIGWLRWARSMVPGRVKPSDNGGRSRGVDVFFAGAKPKPQVLVQSLDLSGVARLAGRPVELNGVMTGFTTEPRLHSQPLRLDLATSGGLPIKLRATIDRTDDIARDEVFATCDALAMPARQLGGDNWFALAVAAGEGTLNVSLLLDGDTLSGDVQLVQKSPRVAIGRQGVDPPSAVRPLQQALAVNLRSLPTIAARVDLGGTLDEPDFKLWSNLGPAVSQAVATAVDSAVQQQSQKLLAGAQAEADKVLAELDGELQAAAEKCGLALAEPGDVLERALAELTGVNPFRYLGRMPGGAKLR